MDLYKILSLIISGISSISIVVLLFQLNNSKKQSKIMSQQLEVCNKQQELDYNLAKNNYEEQRRINTVKVLRSWNEGIKKETRLAEMIVEDFDKKQCTQLYDYLSFEVKASVQEKICLMCSKNKKNCSECKPLANGNYLVEGIQLLELRGNVTKYLNNLEFVAVAWQQAIVDKEIIELQFSFLCNPGKKSALSIYREVAGGGNSYPALNEFYQKIENNKRKSIATKDDL